MRKLYVIRRQDYFHGGMNQLPKQRFAKDGCPISCISQVGSLWITVFLTAEEKNNYTFPISEA